ncbi:MAG: outer membrane protein OmpA-like peptidoglycan-associated protein [Chitinophagales bacterium]
MIKVTKYLIMKTTIYPIILVIFSFQFSLAQVMTTGTGKVVITSKDNKATFVKKEIQITRTAVENADTMFLPNEKGNAKIYVTGKGVYVVANKPSNTITNNEPKTIVLDLEQAKQASELLNTNLTADKEFEEDKIPEHNGFNVQTKPGINAIKSNEKNKKELIEDLKAYSLIDTPEENIIGYIFFEPNSSTIQQKYYTELYKLNYLLEQMPEVEIMLIGHCDIAGSEFQSKTVARSRAQSVYHFLTGILKMDPEKFSIYAEEKNIYDVPEGENIFATNQSQKNRSVTLIIK